MKIIILLCLAAVLALVGTGVAYAMWSDDVTINGTVESGKLCWRFANASLLDDDAPNGAYYPTTNPDYTSSYSGFEYNYNKDENGNELGYYWKLEKNVAWGQTAISEDGKTLTVTLNNTYPCNFNMVSFYVRNCGTIPVKIDTLKLLDNNGNIIATTRTSNPPLYAAMDLNGDTNPDVEIQYGDNFGVQLEPGGASPEFSFWVHTLQPAPQSATLTFSMQISAIQWNEYVAPTRIP